jgi:dihydrodipicolinate synthase/N-acetylneuraminate lyase
MESAVETLRLIEFAADLGYDAALVRTPYFYRNQMERPVNMLAFYRMVADRSPLPVMLYNYPQTTGYELPVELIAELAGHPNIIGIKESSGSVEKIRAIAEATRGIKQSASVTEVQEAVTGRMLKAASAPSSPPAAGDLIPVGALTSQSGGSDASAAKAAPRPSSSAVQVVGGLKTRQKEVGFQVVTGSAHNLLESLDAGAVGGILGFACAAPTACFETLVAWKERATDIAREKQDRIAAAALKVASELSVPGVKYAMDLNGYYGGTVRLPLLPLTAKEKADIERLIVTIRV